MKNLKNLLKNGKKLQLIEFPKEKFFKKNLKILSEIDLSEIFFEKFIFFIKFIVFLSKMSLLKK
jgi:hypothetical protein